MTRKEQRKGEGMVIKDRGREEGRKETRKQRQEQRKEGRTEGRQEGRPSSESNQLLEDATVPCRIVPRQVFLKEGFISLILELRTVVGSQQCAA